MENLFESLNHQDSLFFLLSMLISFLIGFIAAWGMWRGQAVRYQRDAADWKQKHDDIQLDVSELKEKLDLNTADLAKAKREAEMALEQLAATQSDRQKWQRDLDQSLEETVKLHASSHIHQATIEDLNNQIAVLKASNEQLAVAGAALGSNQKEAERIGQLEAKIASLEADNERLLSAAKKEDENVLSLLKSYNDSTNRLGSLEAKIGSLMAENEVLKTELADLKASPTAGVTAGAVATEAIITATNPADKEAITGGAIATSEARDEVMAAIGTTIPLATAEQKDDLTEIKGIGSFLEKKLNALGIFTFEQVSHFDTNLIEKVTAAIEFFPGRIERDNWVGQASQLTLAKTAKAAPIKPDDLKIVEGIGPKIEKLLNEAGIHTWSALAESSVDKIKEVLLNAGERYRIHDPRTWPDQARLAANGDLEKLKQYQDFLSAGKDPDRV